MLFRVVTFKGDYLKVFARWISKNVVQKSFYTDRLKSVIGSISVYPLPIVLQRI